MQYQTFWISFLSSAGGTILQFPPFCNLHVTFHPLTSQPSMLSSHTFLLQSFCWPAHFWTLWRNLENGRHRPGPRPVQGLRPLPDHRPREEPRLVRHRRSPAAGRRWTCPCSSRRAVRRTGPTSVGPVRELRYHRHHVVGADRFGLGGLQHVRQPGRGHDRTGVEWNREEGLDGEVAFKRIYSSRSILLALYSSRPNTSGRSRERVPMFSINALDMKAILIYDLSCQFDTVINIYL